MLRDIKIGDYVTGRLITQILYRKKDKVINIVFTKDGKFYHLENTPGLWRSYELLITSDINHEVQKYAKSYKGWEILKLISENQLKDGAVVKRVSTLGNEQEFIVKRDFISRINDDSLFGQELGNSYFTDESEWYIHDK